MQMQVDSLETARICNLLNYYFKMGGTAWAKNWKIKHLQQPRQLINKTSNDKNLTDEKPNASFKSWQKQDQKNKTKFKTHI